MASFLVDALRLLEEDDEDLFHLNNDVDDDERFDFDELCASLRASNDGPITSSEKTHIYTEGMNDDMAAQLGDALTENNMKGGSVTQHMEVIQLR